MEANPYQPPQAEILVSSEISDAEAIRKAHINHEASVKSVGTLYFLAGVVFLGMGFSSILFTNLQKPFLVALTVAGFFVGIAIVQFWISFGLRKLKPSCRIPTAVMSCIGLLAFPVGTIINAYIIYLVLCKKGQMVLSNEYKQIIAQTPHIKYKTSIIVLILAAIVIAVIVFSVIARFISKGAH